MEKNPWWTSVQGPFPSWKGPVGIKEDGGGSIRGQGRVGEMRLHRAVCLRDKEGETCQAGNRRRRPLQHQPQLKTSITHAEVLRLVDAGQDVNEVEAAGNTPLHNASFEGWVEGVQLLLQLGAKVNASNNAGDTPWHWATNMGHEQVAALLEQVGACGCACTWDGVQACVHEWCIAPSSA